MGWKREREGGEECREVYEDGIGGTSLEPGYEALESRGAFRGRYHGTEPCLSSDHEDPELYDSGVPTDDEADPDEPKPMSIKALRKLLLPLTALGKS